MKPKPIIFPVRSALAFRLVFSCALTLSAVGTSHAQLDPEPRQLLHLGVSQSLHDDGPQAHYLFYYWNSPDFPSTNQILRLIVAPTYLDGELGIKEILGENTDLGLGVFGGGFAYSYDEVHDGVVTDEQRDEQAKRRRNSQPGSQKDIGNSWITITRHAGL
jgi:hypothetical protein